MIPVDIDNFSINGIIGSAAYQNGNYVTFNRRINWVPFNLNKIES